MKKILVSMLFMMILGFSNAAFAETKVAVVDIQAVVNKSAQVQELKKEQQSKAQELDKWLKTVRADIEKQQTQEGKDKLTKKYDAELAKKKEAIAKNYKTKLAQIDKSITESIVDNAKTNGYDLVLSKQGAVLYGGIDITKDLIKIVK